MTLTEIETAFAGILTGLSKPIEWPNVTLQDPVKPYLNVQHIQTGRPARSLTKGMQRGYFQVTVVADRDTNAIAANDLAEQIAALFPFPSKIGTMKTTKPAEFGVPYGDGPDWRLPVRIDYMGAL